MDGMDFAISWSTGSVKIRFLQKEQSFSPSNLYQLGICMYLKRSDDALQLRRDDLKLANSTSEQKTAGISRSVVRPSVAQTGEGMTEPRTSDEIRLRIDELSHEYTKTPKEDPRRGDIASEISALSLQRQILQILI